MNGNNTRAATLSGYYSFCRSLHTTGNTELSEHPFSTARKDHFISWAARNKETLETILPSPLFLEVQNEIVSATSARVVAEYVEKSLFGSASIGGYSFAELLKIRGKELADGVQMLTAAMIKDSNAEAERLVRDGVCIVLVRPEILYLQDLVVLLLESHGFEQIFSRRITLAPEQYIVLYNHVFNHPIKESHVRRRAFGYVNQTCAVILLKRTASYSASESPIHYLNREVKGIVLTENHRTLRGGIALNEAMVNFMDSGHGVRQALDPYKSYTILDHTTKDLSEMNRFVSNLHSVHIPNEDEIVKDLCTLCDLETLRSL